MSVSRRNLGRAVVGGAALAGVWAVFPGAHPRATAQGAAVFRRRLTGADMYPAHNWRVGGTDLGIPYVLENGSIGYLMGDTFAGPWPESGGDHRSPVMLRSAVDPGAPDGIVFDSAAKVAGHGRAPELMHNAHGGWVGGRRELTVIPNDGISFPETGRQVVSFMSMESWDGPFFRSGFAGLAWSDNGNDFHRTELRWDNNGDNTDPFQMWTMQRDGDHVYVFSVRAGRQHGPMMLRRVRWDRMFWPDEYEGWGWNGTDWGWGRPCTGILHERFGEPSVRRLGDGTWAMAYMDYARNQLVTRTASRPDGIWSEPKVQIEHVMNWNLYGGFVHPWSTTRPGGLHLIVSRWARDQQGRSIAYHVEQYQGTL
ncbi:DUF4185 domain-containing protein [Arachnia propionica]|uniref:DUF4185 domain-containing protein n=1 Tax=Arachnia propionica TaxID=1750 RepID=A0A3P1T4F7_9ACTN|nr:DUF4185 domain-containing protein [Arachnia propionica]RRD03696.1 DUF4185 domain-containing protein [Arachnia propionica]